MIYLIGNNYLKSLKKKLKQILKKSKQFFIEIFNFFPMDIEPEHPHLLKSISISNSSISSELNTSPLSPFSLVMDQNFDNEIFLPFPQSNKKLDLANLKKKNQDSKPPLLWKSQNICPNLMAKERSEKIFLTRENLKKNVQLNDINNSNFNQSTDNSVESIKNPLELLKTSSNIAYGSELIFKSPRHSLQQESMISKINFPLKQKNYENLQKCSENKIINTINLNKNRKFEEFFNSPNGSALSQKYTDAEKNLKADSLFESEFENLAV